MWNDSVQQHEIQFIANGLAANKSLKQIYFPLTLGILPICEALVVSQTVSRLELTDVFIIAFPWNNQPF